MTTNEKRLAVIELVRNTYKQALNNRIHAEAELAAAKARKEVTDNYENEISGGLSWKTKNTQFEEEELVRTKKIFECWTEILEFATNTFCEIPESKQQEIVREAEKFGH